VRFLAGVVHDACIDGALDYAREHLALAVEELEAARAEVAAGVEPRLRWVFTEGPAGEAIVAGKAALSSDDRAVLASAALSLRMAGESLSALLAVLDDPGIRHGEWEVERGHLF
jgi:hypothetical protein